MPSWLLRARVAVPDRVPGYVERATLLADVLPTLRPLTILHAPGGFGKTTLLAESCRSLVAEGVLTAWLSLDVQDAPHILDAYLALAFQAGGLDLSDPDELSSHRATHPNRTALVLDAVARHDGPCVLALDELERIADSGSQAVLEFLLTHAPSNLHVAVACRELPDMLDIASMVLERRARVLSAEQLRFGKADVARFFSAKLSRRQLDKAMRDSRGWPFALRILQMERDTGGDGDTRQIIGNWLESRLWRSVSPADRELLLDLGLFEHADAELIDEVLQGTGLKDRIDAIPAVHGLLHSVRIAGTETWGLHPLIRQHCVKQRSQEAPERLRDVHRRLALALRRRGDFVAAMRHATEAADSALAGEILLDAGGMRLWLSEGLLRLQAATRFLTAEVMEASPRLALAHCIVDLFAGRLDEARRTHRTAAKQIAKPPSDPQLALDEVIVRGMFCLNGGERFDGPLYRSTLADYQRHSASTDLDPLMRGTLELGLCIADQMRARFDTALEHAERALRATAGNSYLAMYVDLHKGEVAFAKGLLAAAEAYYASARRTARAHFVRDPAPSVFVEVQTRELDFERNRAIDADAAARSPDAVVACGSPIPAYTAAIGVAIELALAQGLDSALAAVERMRGFAEASGQPVIGRYLAAQTVSLLAGAGRVLDAERTWHLAGLPDRDDDCLDRDGQTWREMESISCARLRLHLAAGRMDTARRFAARFVDSAAAASLRRTQMRAITLAVRVEWQAGAPTDKHAADLVRLYAETGFAGPVVREREVCAPALAALHRRNPPTDVATPAERLLAVVRDRSGDSAAAGFTQRELEVLHGLEALRDREIAERLGLTVAGVRYHLRRIYRKLGAGDRLEAVARARRLGLLSSPSAPPRTQPADAQDATDLERPASP